MLTSTLILSQGSSDFGELAYVIAILLLGGLGALADWIKKRQEASKQQQGRSSPPEMTSESESRVPDLEKLREILTQQIQPRKPQRPEKPPQPPVRRPPVMEMPPGAPARRPGPVPARRAKVVRPPVVDEDDRPRPRVLGEEFATRKIRRVAEAESRAPAVVGKAIEKMETESVTTSVTTAAPGAPRPVAAAVGATVIGPIDRMTPDDLRRAFVMSEILGRPLALREP